jgi:hypothetical protein
MDREGYSIAPLWHDVSPTKRKEMQSSESTQGLVLKWVARERSMDMLAPHLGHGRGTTRVQSPGHFVKPRVLI